MRILQIHNSYQQRGGEDIVAENEAALLTEHGHEVTRYLISNDGIHGLHARARAALSLTWSARAKDSVAEQIARLRPDIAHVHNIFPLLTPSVYDACAESDVPVIQTLHNFRIACAGAKFLRDGAICEKCLHGSPLWGAWHRCYRDSLPGSLAAVHAIAHHRRRATWNSKVTRFVALTEFARVKFVEIGIAPELISVKPNFAPDPRSLQIGAAALADRDGALFVGRLSEEKGVRFLIEAWRNVSCPLTVVGDGPLSAELRRTAPAHVRFEGPLPAQRVQDHMASAAFLVMPSIWYEGFPMTLVEAYASGLPVLGSAIGSIGELIEDGTTGRLVQPGNVDALAAAATALAIDRADCARMGRAARARYEADFTPEKNYRTLLAVFEVALNTIAKH